MEQMGTPGSTENNSVNGSKIGAPKDKQCPFCNQSFTSSSLGRHLDLYIKEKNPKPADGIHDVDEIRKLRGGITRRQPRNSSSKREDSTPTDTPGPHERRSPPPESDMQGNRSPSMRREPLDLTSYSGKPKFFINKATWESTGVMNNIPAARSGDSARSWEGDDRDSGRRMESRNRSVSKQMLAKTTFEQKQKMIDALDNAKAAELALRELLGAIRAAKYGHYAILQNFILTYAGNVLKDLPSSITIPSPSISLHLHSTASHLLRHFIKPCLSQPPHPGPFSLPMNNNTKLSGLTSLVNSTDGVSLAP